MTRIVIAFILLVLTSCEMVYAEEVVINSRQTQLVVPFDADPFSSCAGLPTRSTPNPSDPFYILPGADWRQLITPMSRDDSGSVPVDTPVDLTGSTFNVSFAPSAPIGPYDSMDLVPLSEGYPATSTGYYTCSSLDDTLSGTTCTSSVTGDYPAIPPLYSCFYGGVLSGSICTLAATVDVVSGGLDIRIPADSTAILASWHGSLWITIDGLAELFIPVEIVSAVSRP